MEFVIMSQMLLIELNLYWTQNIPLSLEKTFKIGLNYINTLLSISLFCVKALYSVV